MDALRESGYTGVQTYPDPEYPSFFNFEAEYNVRDNYRFGIEWECMRMRSINADNPLGEEIDRSSISLIFDYIVLQYDLRKFEFATGAGLSYNILAVNPNSDLEEEILNENNLKLDKKKFEFYLKKHVEKSKSKKSFDKKVDKDLKIYKKISRELEVEFTGYQRSSLKTVIENIIKIDKKGNKKIATGLTEGQKGEIILRKTPF